MHDETTQTKGAHNTAPFEDVIHRYKEELIIQTTIADKAKERYDRTKAELAEIKEQATKREAELQKLFHDRMTQLQET